MNAQPQFALKPEPDLLAPIDRAGSKIAEHLGFLAVADSFVEDRLIDIANAIGCTTLHLECDRLRSMLNIGRRDLEATVEQLNEAHDELDAHRYAAETSVGRHLEAKGWLKPHPRLAAAIRKWTSALEAYEAASRHAATVTHENADAAAKLASEALRSLIHTPAPGMRALRSKVAIIAREGVMVANDAVASADILAAIVDDVDRITNATENEPWLVQTDAPTEPCACPTAIPTTTEA